MENKLKNIGLDLEDGITHISIFKGNKNSDQPSQSPVQPRWFQQWRKLSTEDKKSLKEKILKSYKELKNRDTG